MNGEYFERKKKKSSSVYQGVLPLVHGRKPAARQRVWRQRLLLIQLARPKDRRVTAYLYSRYSQTLSCMYSWWSPGD